MCSRQPMLLVFECMCACVRVQTHVCILTRSFPRASRSTAGVRDVSGLHLRVVDGFSRVDGSATSPAGRPRTGVLPARV